MSRRVLRGFLVILLVLGAIYAFLALTAKPRTAHAFLASDRVLVVAHRGGRGQWPENTLYAFSKAAELGVDVLETDVHSTADGVLVLMHDDTVDRTTNGSGPIHGFTLGELRALDAGYRWSEDDGTTYPYRGQGIVVPTLQELFEAFPNWLISVEIKQKDPPIVTDVCRMITDYGLQQGVLVGSFDNDVVKDFRQQCPGIATTATRPEVTRFLILSTLHLDASSHLTADVFFIPEKEGALTVVSPRFLSAAENKGVAVYVWTVNEEADMRRLMGMGVDGLTTDYPSRQLALESGS